MRLPPFNSDGLLPPGDYPLSFKELKKSSLVKASATSSPAWDEIWRGHLVGNLETMVQQLWDVGVDRVFVDGSFVEDKDHPNDIDGYFECNLFELASGELQEKLNALDAKKVWTWDPAKRTAAPNSVKKQLPMWHTYRVELYPHVGQSSGLRDEFGNELQFPSAFRLSRREHKQKGIVLLTKKEVTS
jgi:hypothetical protein